MLLAARTLLGLSKAAPDAEALAHAAAQAGSQALVRRVIAGVLEQAG